MPENFSSYYNSHEKLSFIGEKGQQLLQAAKVLVIGAGGLGCPCLQSLAGCGTGTIGVADFDRVSISNLHRQFLYNVADEGKLKTEVAKQKLIAYNPLINIIVHNVVVDKTNVLLTIKNYDIIIDCTDNFLVRYLINDACVFLDKPLVYGAIHQTEGHVTVFNYQGSPTLRCLFPEADENDNIQSCADIGVYNIVTGIIGLMMANEAIKIILKHEDILAGRLNNIDALTCTTRQIKYNASIDGRKKSIQCFDQLQNNIEISPADLFEKIKNNEEFLLIDVRREDERILYNIGGAHIPEDEFMQHNFEEVASGTMVIIYCQHGIRSLRTAKYMRRKGFANAYSLQGGMHLWQQNYKNV